MGPTWLRAETISGNIQDPSEVIQKRACGTRQVMCTGRVFANPEIEPLPSVQLLNLRVARHPEQIGSEYRNLFPGGSRISGLPRFCVSMQQ